MTKPLISVIICTHNRADYLGIAIASALDQAFTGFEVIVVDNASSDRTRAVVDACIVNASQDQNPPLVYVYEPVLGLSVARNRGAMVAQGEILVYLDDDAKAGAGWLEAIYAAFQDERVAIAGGQSTLIWPGGSQAPPWLSTNLAGSLGLYDLGPETRSITRAADTPRGLNYALRKSFWQQVGGFDTQLGRVGKNLLSNEELHMTQTALRHGHRVVYVPEAAVGHHVALERLCRRWFAQRSWWQGVSESYRERLDGTLTASSLRNRSLCLLRGLVKAMRYRSPAERFDNLVYAYGQLGYLVSGLRTLARPRLTQSESGLGGNAESEEPICPPLSHD